MQSVKEKRIKKSRYYVDLFTSEFTDASAFFKDRKCVTECEKEPNCLFVMCPQFTRNNGKFPQGMDILNSLDSPLQKNRASLKNSSC